MRFSNARRADPLIDVTPMIDIVFQLVLFFMVTTTFITSPGIQVDLPRSEAQTLVNDDKDINIWVSVDGLVYLNEEAVTVDGLRDALRGASQRDLETLVILKADTGATHGRVVEVMDLARGFGLTRLAIATQPPDKSSPESP